MSLSKFVRATFAVLLVSFLSACGGGGSSSGCQPGDPDCTVEPVAINVVGVDGPLANAIVGLYRLQDYLAQGLLAQSLIGQGTEVRTDATGLAAGVKVVQDSGPGPFVLVFRSDANTDDLTTPAVEPPVINEIKRIITAQEYAERRNVYYATSLTDLVVEIAVARSGGSSSTVIASLAGIADEVEAIFGYGMNNDPNNGVDIRQTPPVLDASVDNDNPAQVLVAEYRSALEAYAETLSQVSVLKGGLEPASIVKALAQDARDDGDIDDIDVYAVVDAIDPTFLSNRFSGTIENLLANEALAAGITVVGPFPFIPSVPDSDGDGVINTLDDLPGNNAAAIDTDGDGMPDSFLPSCNATCQATSGLVLDDDDDNDGTLDVDDDFRTNARYDSDFDGDGEPDALLPGCNAACQANYPALMVDDDDDDDGELDGADNCGPGDTFNPYSIDDVNSNGLRADDRFFTDPTSDPPTAAPPQPQVGVAANDQTDTDGDGLGDICDPDADGDGAPNISVNDNGTPGDTSDDYDEPGDDAPFDPAVTLDVDNDLVDDLLGPDNCIGGDDGVDTPNFNIWSIIDAGVPGDRTDDVFDVGGALQPDTGTASADQTDTDGDGAGDICDADADGDGVPNFDAQGNADDPQPFNAAGDSDFDGVIDAIDNCIGGAVTFNPGEGGPDFNGQNNGIGDGTLDGIFNSEGTSLSDQTDTDSDGSGDICDSDKDGDSILNENDPDELDFTHEYRLDAWGSSSETFTSLDEFILFLGSESGVRTDDSTNFDTTNDNTLDLGNDEAGDGTLSFQRQFEEVETELPFGGGCIAGTDCSIAGSVQTPVLQVTPNLVTDVSSVSAVYSQAQKRLSLNFGRITLEAESDASFAVETLQNHAANGVPLSSFGHSFFGTERPTGKVYALDNSCATALGIQGGFPYGNQNDLQVALDGLTPATAASAATGGCSELSDYRGDEFIVLAPENPTLLQADFNSTNFGLVEISASLSDTTTTNLLNMSSRISELAMDGSAVITQSNNSVFTSSSGVSDFGLTFNPAVDPFGAITGPVTIGLGGSEGEIELSRGGTPLVGMVPTDLQLISFVEFAAGGGGSSDTVGRAFAVKLDSTGSVTDADLIGKTFELKGKAISSSNLRFKHQSISGATLSFAAGTNPGDLTAVLVLGGSAAVEAVFDEADLDGNMTLDNNLPTPVNSTLGGSLTTDVDFSVAPNGRFGPLTFEGSGSSIHLEGFYSESGGLLLRVVEGSAQDAGTTDPELFLIGGTVGADQLSVDYHVANDPNGVVQGNYALWDGVSQPPNLVAETDIPYALGPGPDAVWDTADDITAVQAYGGDGVPAGTFTGVCGAIGNDPDPCGPNGVLDGIVVGSDDLLAEIQPGRSIIAVVIVLPAAQKVSFTDNAVGGSPATQDQAAVDGVESGPFDEYVIMQGVVIGIEQ